MRLLPSSHKNSATLLPYSSAFRYVRVRTRRDKTYETHIHIEPLLEIPADPAEPGARPADDDNASDLGRQGWWRRHSQHHEINLAPVAPKRKVKALTDTELIKISVESASSQWAAKLGFALVQSST